VSKGRLEAFSDGVVAILITIMVLELHAPDGRSLHALRPLVPVFLAYLLSFINIGIYWNNHHHLLQATREVDGGVLWANLHLLFWLSLFPFGTAWLSDSHFARTPVAAYAVISLAAAVAYGLLTWSIIRAQSDPSRLQAALGRDLKGKLSPGLYVLAIVGSLASRWLAVALVVSVALLWLVPDRRLERRLAEESGALDDEG
jgi:uncharacterized membrane protein